jgi:hypothetical protein
MNNLEMGEQERVASAACEGGLSARRTRAILVSVRYGSPEWGRPICSTSLRLRAGGAEQRRRRVRGELRRRMSASACLLALSECEGGSRAWEESSRVDWDNYWDTVSGLKEDKLCQYVVNDAVLG